MERAEVLGEGRDGKCVKRVGWSAGVRTKVGSEQMREEVKDKCVYKYV